MDPPKVPVPKGALEEHLRDQLQFLRLSAEAYDSGFEGEAKRLAIALRVLFHDTKNSHSLLGQLNRLGASFLSTAMPRPPGSITSHFGLVTMGLKEGDTKYLAMLDDVPVKRWLPFADWWGEVVFADGKGQEMTRRGLVTTAADQDGGAHVDPELDATYAALASGELLGWMSKKGNDEAPIPLAARAGVRQIAHETLATLVPGYAKKPQHVVEMFMASAAAFDSPIPPMLELPAEPSRNDPCPCGSGRKYKKCHGKLG
jgi:hypothetical protein